MSGDAGGVAGSTAYEELAAENARPRTLVAELNGANKSYRVLIVEQTRVIEAQGAEVAELLARVAWGRDRVIHITALM